MPQRGLLSAPPQRGPLLGSKAVLASYTPTATERIVDWLARTWYGDNRQGTRQAERLMDVVNISPLGLGPLAYDVGRAGASGDLATAGSLAAVMALPVPKAAKDDIAKGVSKGFTAYHGSPHSFDEFDIGKIGTGEGAQSYGHGLYFAGDEKVARHYRDKLQTVQYGGGQINPSDPSHVAVSAIEFMNGDKKKATAFLRSRAKDMDWDLNNTAADMIESGAPLPERLASGSMYQVNIAADPNDFLDWDKPLSEQTPAIKAKIAPYFEQAPEPSWAFGPFTDRLVHKSTRQFAEDLPSLVASSGGKAEKEFREAGIPGIKYLDAGSRGPSTYYNVGVPRSDFGPYSPFNNMADAEKHLAMLRKQGFHDAEITTQLMPQTHNYVIFDDKLLSIIKKYGIAGASLIAGHNIMDGLTPDQAQAALAADQESQIDRPWYLNAR